MMLKEKIALITGAAAGIGEAVAHLFNEHGAHLYLMDRDAEGCRAVAACLTSASAFKGDVRSAADVAAVVDAAIAAHGRIDVLINNAGIYPRQMFLDMTEAQWDEMQDINLKSMFRTMKAVLPHMVRRNSGRIVNISSVTFHLGM